MGYNEGIPISLPSLNIGAFTIEDVSSFLSVSSTNPAAYSSVAYRNLDPTGFVRATFDIGSGLPGSAGSAVIKYAPGLFFGIGVDANDAVTPLILTTNNGTAQLVITAAGLVICSAALTSPVISSAQYYIGANPGIDASVTTASLIGKTLTIEKGLITGFA